MKARAGTTPPHRKNQERLVTDFENLGWFRLTRECHKHRPSGSEHMRVSEKEYQVFKDGEVLRKRIVLHEVYGLLKYLQYAVQ
jgi:succinylglutamate desuccinylase